MDKLPSTQQTVSLHQARDKINEIIDDEAAGTFGGSVTRIDNYGTGVAPDSSKYVDKCSYFSQTATVSGGGTIMQGWCKGPEWVTLNGEFRVAGYYTSWLGSNDPAVDTTAQEARPLQIPWNDYNIEHNGGYLSSSGMRGTGPTGLRISNIQNLSHNTRGTSFLTENGEVWLSNADHADPDTTYKKGFRGFFRVGSNALQYSAARSWDTYENNYHGICGIWNPGGGGTVDMSIDSAGYKAIDGQKGTLSVIGTNHRGVCGIGNTNYGGWQNEWVYPTLTVPAASASGPSRTIYTNLEDDVILTKHYGGTVLAICDNGTVWGAGMNMAGMLSPGFGQAGDTTYCTSYDSTFIDQPAVGANVKKFLCIYGAQQENPIANWGKAINVWSNGGYADHGRGNTYILTDKGNLLACGSARYLGYQMDDGHHNTLNTDSGSYKRQFDIIAGPDKSSSSWNYTSDLSLSVRRFWMNDGYYRQCFIEFNDPDQRGSTLYSFGYNAFGCLGHNNADCVPSVSDTHIQTVPYVVTSPLRGTWKAGTFNNPIHGSDPSTDYAQSANMAGPDNWIKVKDIALHSGPDNDELGHYQVTALLTEDGRAFVCGYTYAAGDGNRRISLFGTSLYFEGNRNEAKEHGNYLNYTTTNYPGIDYHYRWCEVNTSTWIGKPIKMGVTWWGNYSATVFYTDKGAVYHIGKEYYGTSASLTEDWTSYYQSPLRALTLGQC